MGSAGSLACARTDASKVFDGPGVALFPWPLFQGLYMPEHLPDQLLSLGQFAVLQHLILCLTLVVVVF
jgi:hypothetical protein